MLLITPRKFVALTLYPSLTRGTHQSPAFSFECSGGTDGLKRVQDNVYTPGSQTRIQGAALDRNCHSELMM